MHPAVSIVLFTSLSGAGYGALVWLGLFQAADLLPQGRVFGIIAAGLSADPGDTYTVIVGAGGTGALAGNRNGQDGETSSFGSSLQATGGAGGLAANLGAIGGEGGWGSGVGIGETGSDGGNGTMESWATGGNCAGDGGGRGGGNVFEGGRAASPPGGGGGSAGGSGQTGGDGARGEIYVSWSD